MLKHFGKLRSLCPALLTNEHLVWSSCSLIAHIPLHIELLLVCAILNSDNLVVTTCCSRSWRFSFLYIYLNFVAAFQALYFIVTWSTFRIWLLQRLQCFLRTWLSLSIKGLPRNASLPRFAYHGHTRLLLGASNPIPTLIPYGLHGVDRVKGSLKVWNHVLPLLG